MEDSCILKSGCNDTWAEEMQVVLKLVRHSRADTFRAAGTTRWGLRLRRAAGIVGLSLFQPSIHAESSQKQIPQ